MLTDEQLATFARDGYVLLRGVVAESFLVAADAEIDELIAEEGVPEGKVGHHSYWPKPSRLPACDAALRNSGALDLANELVSPHCLDHAMNDCIQVATNIPPWSHIPGGPHLDNHSNFAELPGSFTLLAGIYLTDESEPARGNIWIWPGSHITHQEIFREQGVDALVATGGHATISGAPLPVLADRGDLLLAHFLVGHNTGGNETDRVRRIIYYRLACENHRDRWRDTFVDAFTEYAPLRAYAKRS